ncbi:MAG: aldehyde ferredoxin oxidoreductase C-terminal domain-containing protein, partial [Fervidobacterium sp.]
LCEIDDIKAIAKINDFCDKYGLDTMSAGNVVALAIEAYEQGKLKSEIPLKYGDPEVVLRLLEHIAKKEGIGVILSNGVRDLSKILGMEDFAVHVKGLEPAGYDPRGLKGMALGFAVTSSGASHMRTTWFAQDIASKPFDRFDVSEDKVKFLVSIENWICVLDSMILCLFGRVYYPMKTLVEIYNAVTGVKIDEVHLQKAAERIINLSRQFNVREGLTRKDDMLPRRLETEPLQHGYSKGAKLSPEEMNSMLDYYYSLRGWNKDGKPTIETLE